MQQGGAGEPPQFTPPDPRSVVDEEHARKLARNSQLTLIESRGENRRFHTREARQLYRAEVRAARGRIRALVRKLSQARPGLSDLRRQKGYRERFVGQQQVEGKKPATAFEHAKFGLLLVLLVLAVTNGTLTASSWMMSTPAFEASKIKAIAVGLGLFLMPSVGAYFPFMLLFGRRPRAARAYLLALAAGGLVCFFLFGLTWSYQYAGETGNELLLDLTTIGMGSGETEEEDLFWLFRHASWLSLLTNILADAAFAGCAKAGMSLLAEEYAMFRRRPIQQDPEWQLLDQEAQSVVNEIAELEAEQTRAEDRLNDIKREREEYAANVCSLADVVLLREVDRQEARRLELRSLQDDLAASETAMTETRQQLQRYLLENPGVLSKGDSDDAQS